MTSILRWLSFWLCVLESLSLSLSCVAHCSRCALFSALQLYAAGFTGHFLYWCTDIEIMLQIIYTSMFYCSRYNMPIEDKSIEL